MCKKLFSFYLNFNKICIETRERLEKAKKVMMRKESFLSEVVSGELHAAEQKHVGLIA